MKLTRRESIKAIASMIGTPLLSKREAEAGMTQERFEFGEEMSGRIAEDTQQTDAYPPRITRAIYDFKRGEEKGKSEISFEGAVVIDDIDAFEEDPIHAARFEGKVIYNRETFSIDNGKVKLFTPEYYPQVRYLIYLLPFTTTRGQYVLSGYKKIKIINLNPVDFFKDMVTLYVHLHKGPLDGSLESPKLGPMLGAGIMRFNVKDIYGLLQSSKPIYASLRFFTIIAGETIKSVLPWPSSKLGR